MNKFRLLPIIALLAFSFSSCGLFQPISTSPTSKPTVSKDSKEQLLRKDIVRYAKQFVGTPYKYASRDPRKGFDCSGFTHYVMKEFDINLSPSSAVQENEGTPIDVKSVKAGDLIFFRRTKKGKVFHVALVYENTREGIKIIHSTSRGVVIDNLTTNSYWSVKIPSARDVVSKSV
ncbi:MAG: C40 family peptidase [Bacteroidota bacterium]